ncbi:glycerol-3-phosphate responsive antiterminator [Escherichia coli]
MNSCQLYAQSAGLGDREIRQPLIAGGLVCDEEDARNAINAGVVALSTTNTGVYVSEKITLTG